MIRTQFAAIVLAAMAFATTASTAIAQLQITEILYDSRTNPEASWEWFEVYNAGDADIDLDGYFLDDLSTSNAQSAPNILSLVGDATVNTIVPSKTAAVVYNGVGLDFDESRFRNAWQLPGTVPLIGVNSWRSLNQGGDQFGIWDSFESYELDLANTDADEELEVAQFNNAIVSINYDAEGFPGAPAGSSLQWNGTGDYQSGENWGPTEEGTGMLSIATSLAETPINNTNDIGNPSTVLGSTDGFDSLAITEIMYNPASEPDGDWEWIEVYNGTGSTIDFAASPYFFDDKAGTAIAEANVNTGSIPAGEAAILHNEDISADNMEIAWGDGNYIAVGSWPSLNNSGDTIGLWDDADEYAIDGEAAGDRLVEGAVFSVTYEDGDADWPNVGQGNSISIVDLEESSDLGTNWSLSIDDGDSTFANAIISSLADHAGDDLATPGTFGEVEPPTGLDLNGDGSIDADDAPLLCAAAGGDVGAFLEANGGIQGDFNLSGTVDFADFLLLSTNFLSEGDYSQGNANCAAQIDFADFLVLSANFGQSASAASVPEPTSQSILLCLVPSVFLLLRRERR